MKEETEGWLKSGDSKDYFELLKFPTVGADPSHLKDCVQAATWLKKWLKSIGAEAELVLPKGAPDPATSVPVVCGELKGGDGATTVLVYGHYDVQPPDPLDLWETPPFEPTVKDGRVYCRGAQDDKGQLFAFLCGLRELAAGGWKGPTVKFVLDGQEESGSGTLFRLLEDRDFRRRIAADVMLVSDTGAAADLRPAIVAGLRGVNHFTVKLVAANRDLHSGEYGGIAPNAAQGMAELMASLHNADGSIAVEGFCDGIEPPTEEELAAAEEGFADAAAYEKDIGTEPCGGAAGKTIVQRNCFEPTIEVNGSDPVRGDGEALYAARPRAEPGAHVRGDKGASRGEVPEGDEGLVPRRMRALRRDEASARLAALPPCGERARRDGPARGRLHVGRRVDTRRICASRGDVRSAASRRLGTARRPHTLSERIVFRPPVRGGEGLGAAHTLRALT